MTTIQNIILTQTEWKIPKVVHAVQGDTGRSLKMIISDQTIPSGATATLSIHRSDDSYYEINCDFIQADNAFTADITQALTQSGTTECQLIVSGDVSAYIFLIEVQRAAQGVPETQEGYTITHAIELAESAADRAEAAAQASGLSDEAKQALLACFRQVAWIGDDGQYYYDALEAALYPDATLVSISAVYTQSGTVYDTDSLDSLKADLVVTAHYDDSSSSVISSYTLSGTLTAGTSTITVSYSGKTTTFTVTVTQYWDVSWDYSQGTPIGKGFEHSTAVTGTMVSDGYQIKGTSSGGCNIILSENGSATKGVTEIVANMSELASDFIGFHFDVKDLWAFIINKKNSSSPVFWYQNTDGTPSPSSVTALPNISVPLNTDFTMKLEWDDTAGATAYINGEEAYKITGALIASQRTRWFLSCDSNASTVLIKSIKVRTE